MVDRSGGNGTLKLVQPHVEHHMEHLHNFSKSLYESVSYAAGGRGAASVAETATFAEQSSSLVEQSDFAEKSNAAEVARRDFPMLATSFTRALKLSPLG